MGQTYNFPVWATQGGGLVREVGEHFVFVKKPSCPGLGVGDLMPKEWGIEPANRRASIETELEEQTATGFSGQAAFDGGKYAY